MSNRVILITGASSGIGEATAKRFTACGDQVVIGARREDRLAKIAEETGCDYHVLDVCDHQSVEEFVSYAKMRYGRIDVLVNNAGVMLLSPVADGKTTEWERMVDINLKGVLTCTNAVLPLMEAQGEGMIVNVDSTAGYRVMANSAIYSATKFAVRAFSDGLRKEESNKGIRVTVVAPGPTKTELVSHISDESLRGDTERFTAEGLEATDVADCIVFAANMPKRASVDELIVSPVHKL